jgi:hypothetical protein
VAKKPRSKSEDALACLVAIMDTKESRPNDFSPGIAVARLDAAEALLRHGDDAQRRDASEFLTRAMGGKVPSLGVVGRVRAAKILLEVAAPPAADKTGGDS